MPFVRNVFIVGALALAGLPILNGFWSKELVLEAGLAGGPAWAYVRHAARCRPDRALHLPLRLDGVLRRAARGQAHVHDAGPAMQVALWPLALGTLTTWLLARPIHRVPGEPVRVTGPARGRHRTSSGARRNSWRRVHHHRDVARDRDRPGRHRAGPHRLVAARRASTGIARRLQRAGMGVGRQLRVRGDQPRSRRSHPGCGRVAARHPDRPAQLEHRRHRRRARRWCWPSWPWEGTDV